jgi:hypothetical protein
VFAGQPYDQASIDMGYAAVDTASAVSQTAGSVSYQSRHWINVDLGSAQAATVSIVRGHNISAAGTVTFEADILTMVSVPVGDIVAPDFVQALSGTDPRIAFFSSQSKRYLRLIISDVQNPVGYVELGVWFVGAAAQPTVGPSIQFAIQKEPLSSIVFADGGAHQQILRTRRRVWMLTWQLENRAGLAVADRALFDALDALGIGASFFICLDDADPTATTMYGFNRVGLHESFQQGTIWVIVLEFAEALG